MRGRGAVSGRYDNLGVDQGTRAAAGVDRGWKLAAFRDLAAVDSWRNRQQPGAQVHKHSKTMRHHEELGQPSPALERVHSAKRKTRKNSQERVKESTLKAHQYALVQMNH